MHRLLNIALDPEIRAGYRRVQEEEANPQGIQEEEAPPLETDRRANAPLDLLMNPWSRFGPFAPPAVAAGAGAAARAAELRKHAHAPCTAT